MFGVDDAIIAAGVSAAGNLAGGLLGGGSNNHAGRDARQATSYAIRASVLDKVAAAKEAGISPLYALGAPVASSSWVPGSGNNGSLGQALSNMGQDVSRAIASRQSDAERALQTLTLQKAGLENDYLRAQINSLNARTAQQAAPPAVGMVPEQVQAPQRTTGANFGTGFFFDPSMSDIGQIIEDRYGDDNPLTWPLGAAAMIKDADYIFGRMMPKGFSSPAEAGRSVRRYFGF